MAINFCPQKELDIESVVSSQTPPTHFTCVIIIIIIIIIINSVLHVVYTVLCIL